MSLVRRVADPSWFFEGSEGLVFPFRVCNSGDGVDPDQSVFEIRVEGKTAPGPGFRVIDQFPFQRIHVHIVKFFDSLLQAPYVFLAGSPSGFRVNK